jgi:hypothetical protein
MVGCRRSVSHQGLRVGSRRVGRAREPSHLVLLQHRQVDRLVPRRLEGVFDVARRVAVVWGGEDLRQGVAGAWGLGGGEGR